MIKKINVSLNKDLRERYGVRAFPITKGDLVKVKSGKRKGEGGKVSFVDHSEKGIQVEGINIAKADGKEKQFLIRPEKLVITKLDITDERRLERIKEIATIKHKDLSAIEKEALEQKKEAEEQEKAESETMQEAEVVDDNDSVSEPAEAEDSELSKDDEMDLEDEKDEEEDTEEENVEDEIRKEEDSNDNQE